MSAAASPVIGIIILAAGSSSRLGQPKQLLQIDNEPLLRRSVDSAMKSKTEYVVVVLGSNSKAHREVIKDLGADSIENPTWRKGMGNSLKAGLDHLLSRQPRLDAALIMVCDQPKVSADLLNRIVDEYKTSGKPVVASHYADSPGVPALIDKILFEELRTLDDTQGAKKIILKHKGEAALVEFPEGIIDIDTPEDYQRYLKGV